MSLVKLIPLIIYTLIICSPQIAEYSITFQTIFDCLLVMTIGLLPFVLRILNSRFLYLVFSPYFFIAALSWYYYAIYQNFINPGFIAEQILFFSKADGYEIIEFSFKHGLAIIIGLILLSMFLFAKPVKMIKCKKVSLIFIGCTICFLLSKFILFNIQNDSFNKLLLENTYTSFVYKTFKARAYINEINLLFDRDQSADIKFIKKYKDNDSFTHIIVMGGEQNKKKWSLYDNEVITNLGLEAVENLTVFEDMVVISPELMTNKKYITYLGGKDKRINIIKILNRANIHTMYISSSPQFGPYKLNGVLAKTSKESVFFRNHEDDKFYDMQIVDWIKANIKIERKNVIFISLPGMTPDYKKKYPSSFGEFQDDLSGSVALDNVYNNALQYHDKVITELINVLDKMKQSSFLVYVAEKAIGEVNDPLAKSNYEIPFFLWRSKKYKENNIGLINDLSKQASMPLRINDLPQSILKLIGIEVDRLSFFDRAYRSKRRIILGPKEEYLDFDDLR